MIRQIAYLGTWYLEIPNEIAFCVQDLKTKTYKILKSKTKKKKKI